MASDELFGLVRRFTVARLLEREDFSRRMEAGRRSPCSSSSTRCSRGMTRLRCEADVEVGGTDQKFNLLFGRDVQDAFGQPAQSILTMPILAGTDGVRRMSKSLRQLRRGHGSTGGDVREADERPRLGRWASTTGVLLRARSSTPAAHPAEAKRELAGALVERFHGARCGRRGGGALRPAARAGGGARPRSRRRWSRRRPERFRPPAGAARRAVRPQPQRGAAADRAGRRADRRPRRGVGTARLAGVGARWAGATSRKAPSSTAARPMRLRRVEGCQAWRRADARRRRDILLGRPVGGSRLPESPSVRARSGP